MELVIWSKNIPKNKGKTKLTSIKMISSNLYLSKKEDKSGYKL
jgi:hypothetical protein